MKTQELNKIKSYSTKKLKNDRANSPGGKIETKKLKNALKMTEETTRKFEVGARNINQKRACQRQKIHLTKHNKKPEGEIK